MMPHPLDSQTARRTSYEDSYYFDEDRCGLELTDHEITIEKPVENSILGLTLSGGIPVCRGGFQDEFFRFVNFLGIIERSLENDKKVIF